MGAANDVTANTVGSVSHAQTEIETGMMPRKRARIQTLEKEIEKLKGELVKLNQLDTYLEKSKGEMDNEMWTKLHLSGIENRRINNEETEAFTKEIEDLKYEIEHATDSRIHVFETAFSGSRIVIGPSSFKVNTEIGFASFRYSNGEIVYGPCEMSKGDIK